jgi:hypothetical protein
MRLVEITSQYLHGSRQQLAPGTLLTPRGDSMAGVDDDLEETLEKARPPTMPRRDAVIYMARDRRTLENVARDSDYIYVVTPIGAVLRLDGAWINRLFTLCAQHEDELDNPDIVHKAHSYAQGYWSGRKCPAYALGDETIWEYMAPQARVIREMR